MSNELVFDSAEPMSVPVTIAGKKYQATEATESTAARYRDAQLRGMRVIEGADGNKTSAVSAIHDTESLLVSLCLFEVLEDGTNKAVSVEIIKKWSHRIVKSIFNLIEEISNLKTVDTLDSIDKKIKELQDKRNKMVTSGHSEQEANTKN